MSAWPLFDLTVASPRMTLRYADDALAERLAHLAARGIHPPGAAPFASEWSEVPSPGLERGALQWHWRNRADWAPGRWRAMFAALVDGEVVGTMDIGAERFAQMREVTTGSWVGAAHQGRGLGTEMRRLVLALAFDGLGADYARSAAWEDNHASLGVSRKLGYREAGRRRDLRRGRPEWVVQVLLTREDWERQGHGDVRITGLDACRELFGLSAEA